MIVPPSLVSEYSKALALPLAARRYGLSFSEKRIVGVHLPIKIASLPLLLLFSIFDITWCLLLTR
jgi:hypothetical protein